MLSVFCLSIYGQTNGEISDNIMKSPDIAPHTPEANQLLKMYEVPVNGYTGTPDITIPLYSMKVGNIELPVTLTYQASGIRVNQESGWVGLGWMLSIGGVVRQQVGALDSRHVSHKNDWDRMLSEWKDKHNFGGPFQVCEGIENGHPLWNPCGEHSEDYTPEGVIYDAIHGCGEKDLFVVTLPNGKSCKYVITDIENDDNGYQPYNIAFVGNHPKLKICHYNDKVDIYDTDGTLYRYMASNYQEGVAMEFTLQEIVSINNDHINVKSEEQSENSLLCSELFVLDGPPEIRTTRTPMENEVGSNCPVEISTKKEKMTFFVRKIDFGINKTFNYQLDSIVVKSTISGKRIRKYLFNYGQFANCEIGGNFGNEVPSINFTEFSKYSNSYLSYRPQLKSLVIYGSADKDEELYKFSYNEDNPLPLKSSFSTDLWGYYNGQDNSGLITGYPHTFIPNGCSLPINGDNEKFFEALKTGADRRCYAKYICSGMLKSITYPTGGIEQFEFEPNTFRNYYLLSAEDYSHYRQNTYYQTYCNNNSSNTKLIPQEISFNLVHPSTVKVHTTVAFNDYTQAQVVGSGTTIASTLNGKVWQLILQNNDKTSRKCFERYDTLQLQAGKYMMISHLTGVKAQDEYNMRNVSSATIECTYVDTAYLKNVNSCGGGIRVKSITTYNKNGNEVQKDVYDYNYKNGYSSGILLSPLNNIEKVYIHECTEGDTITTPARANYFNAKLFHSGSVSTFSLEGNGIVGYQQITKSIFHNDSLVRREIMNYSCQPAIQYSYYYHFGANLNGELLSKEIYNSRDQLVSKEQNDYGISDHTGVYCNVKVVDNYIGPDHCKCISTYACINPFMYNGRFHITMAPSEGFHINLLHHRKSLYFANGDSIMYDNIMKYNNMYQQTSTQTLTSKGNYRIDSIEYLTPSVISNIDYPYNSLNDIDNIYTHSVKDNNAQCKQTNYYSIRNTYRPVLATSQLQFNGTKDMELTYQYNDSLKVTEITKNGIVPDVFLWGYRCTEIVAHITGCTIEEVKSKLGDSFINRISAADDFTTDDDSQLRKLLPQTCKIITFKYDPSVGIVMQTDERGHQTTYGYDDFHRLNQVYDQNGKMTSSTVYHYSN